MRKTLSSSDANALKKEYWQYGLSRKDLSARKKTHMLKKEKKLQLLLVIDTKENEKYKGLK